MSDRTGMRFEGKKIRADFARWMLYAATALSLAALSGCGSIRKLERVDPDAGLNLPFRQQSDVERERIADSLARIRSERQKLITYKKQDGTELYFAPTAIDSLTGRQIIALDIEQITVTASSRRNVAERSGKINLEFIVTVPEALQDKRWRLVLEPRLLKGPDTLTLDPLVVSGERFRRLQNRQYARHREFLDRIVDSADYFRHFGDKRAFARRFDRIGTRQRMYAALAARIDSMSVDQALADPCVGMFGRREYRRLLGCLERYVRKTDRLIARRTLYRSSVSDKYDYLTDYFSPRYRFASDKPAPSPGGSVYTRIDGSYPDLREQRREAFLQGVADSVARGGRRSRTQRPVIHYERLSEAAGERMRHTGLEPEPLKGMILQMSDSARCVNHRVRLQYYASQAEGLSDADTLGLMRRYTVQRKVERNRRLEARRAAVFARQVNFPFVDPAKFDTVVPLSGKIRFRYAEQVDADEHTSRLHLFLTGRVNDLVDREYLLKRSDTLTYAVASMTAFVDDAPRYVQRIITRDAEANARFYFVFPKGKSVLPDGDSLNRRQIDAVKDLTRRLMTDPVFIIDSITLRATSSPEGPLRVNERLSRERAEAIREVLVREFRTLCDSLRVASDYILDHAGRTVRRDAAERLSDLPDLLHTAWLAEDWERLADLIRRDTVLEERDRLLEIIRTVDPPDRREWRIRTRFPKAYAYMLTTLYPQMRAVDFRFNLHRRGMQQDTVYTTELDSAYMRGRELLRERRYEQALAILRPYKDRNTALACMSLGYDAAARRILRGLRGVGADAEAQYLLAILAARSGDEEEAVLYYLRSVELQPKFRFRGNLDPEISRLILKYDFFSDR